MVYDLEQENKEILARYKDLISNTYRSLDEENNKLIRKAFDIALDAHKDQRRKTGEPYIYHPIEVAKIVANEIDTDTQYDIAMFVESYNLLLTEEQEAFLIKEINKLISKQGGD